MLGESGRQIFTNSFEEKKEFYATPITSRGRCTGSTGSWWTTRIPADHPSYDPSDPDGSYDGWSKPDNIPMDRTIMKGEMTKSAAAANEVGIKYFRDFDSPKYADNPKMFIYKMLWTNSVTPIFVYIVGNPDKKNIYKPKYLSFSEPLNRKHLGKDLGKNPLPQVDRFRPNPVEGVHKSQTIRNQQHAHKNWSSVIIPSWEQNRVAETFSSLRCLKFASGHARVAKREKGK